MKNVLDFIMIIIKIPYWWMPKSWKGYRTIIITYAVAILSILQGLDLFSLQAAINEIGQLFNPNFLIKLPIEYLLTWIGIALAELRKETNTEVFKKYKNHK